MNNGKPAKWKDPGKSGSRRIERVALAAAVVTLALAPFSLTAQPVAVEDWKEVRTASFVLRSNASIERTAAIAQTLEVFRAAFSGLAPEMEMSSPVPTRIVAFRDEASFAPFKSGHESGEGRVLGQFLSHPDGNYMTLNADPRLLGGFGVVLHEYVHFLVAHNFPGVPRWFNEGLAEYYSTFAVESGYAVVGRPVERHLEWLRRHGRLDLTEVLEVRATGAGHAEVEAGHYYAASWGLVHYLLSSRSPMSGRLARFLGSAAEPSPASRFEEIFELRLEDLEQELRGYLLNGRPPAASLPLTEFATAAHVDVVSASPAAVLGDLGGLRVRLGDEISAGRLYDLALAYDPDNADAYAGLAHVRDLEQRFEEADVLFAEALARGPLDPRSYLLYGRHLLVRLEGARRTGDTAAVGRLAVVARDAFQMALDLAPTFGEASALAGYVHLFGDLEPRGGVAYLERAIDLLPGRVDLYFQLMQLEARGEGLGRARALADGPIRQFGGEEWGMRADEELDRLALLQKADEALKAGKVEQGIELLERAIAITSDADLRYRLEDNLERLAERVEKR
ncbi:MAG: DUF1570 domain-containing protein [Acidobacteriota bacterium]|nr:DUF1570 domain-containing protein [Acidobacteriota bacterium]